MNSKILLNSLHQHHFSAPLPIFRSLDLIIFELHQKNTYGFNCFVVNALGKNIKKIFLIPNAASGLNFDAKLEILRIKSKHRFGRVFLQIYTAAIIEMINVRVFSFFFLKKK